MVISKKFLCEGCGTTKDVQLDEKPLPYWLRKLQQEGWVIEKNAHYCPKCADAYMAGCLHGMKQCDGK